MDLQKPNIRKRPVPEAHSDALKCRAVASPPQEILDKVLHSVTGYPRFLHKIF